LTPDVVPEESVSEGIAEAFRQFDMDGARVLLPRAASAREIIPQALAELGASVDISDAYRNIIPAEAEPRIKSWRQSGGRADWIVFTSGSTVKNWLALAGRESLEGVKVVSIGPATSEVVRKHGLEVTVEANPHTIDGIVAAILAWP